MGGGGGAFTFFFGSKSGAYIKNICLWVRHWSFFPALGNDKLHPGVTTVSSIMAFQ